MLIYESTLDEETMLSDHISEVLDLLEKFPPRWRENRDKIGCDIFCMYSAEHGQGSMELDLDLLARLTHHRVELILDLYPPTCPHCDAEDGEE